MTIPDTTDQDIVTSWLQDREMTDHKLGDARSGIAREVDIVTAIGRLTDSACEAFPNMEMESVHSYVRSYIDPHERVAVGSWTTP